ncbi:Protein Gawky [Amphibalanus amphitrite]|uniref:Protein Gawky n=1 Tax=Amphibalanus amphitrite TaxID=1232801 RepID=A0A6A4X681_AMPAM|nr:Protein Gawky [Amphibalanus amphitrite]
MRAVEDDPALTPGSARSSLGLSAGAGSQDLLGKSSAPGATDPLSSTWSFNPSSSGKHGLGGSAKWDGGADWAVKSRGPPPGLNKSVGSGGGGGGWGRGFDQRSAFAPVQGGGGGGWGSPGSAWLLLRNLTAQIDGSTLKTLCMQHGPLHTFHMYLSQGVALVKYGSREEAAKAQGALNNCVLSNTTIMAESVTDETAAQALQQLGLPGSQQGGSGGGAAAKPPASAAWSDMGADSGGLGTATSMAWSSGGAGNGTLWATGGLDESGRGAAYLPEGLL